MISVDTSPSLLEFARDFIREIDHHRDVRTELLAESFRQRFGLPPFPSLPDLDAVCGTVGVGLKRLSSLPRGLPGLNVWHGDSSPAIYLGDDLARGYAETTLCHELREVIENAFKRVKPDYEALNTADNRTMNPESEQFGGCLLMQAEACRARLREAGFDFPVLASALGRSLPSLVLRCRRLFPAHRAEPGPVAGVWLFEVPWEAVESGRAAVDQLKLRYYAHLSGFSARKGGTAAQSLARRVFPARGAMATDFRIAIDAIDAGRPVIGYLGGFDLFGERDFVVGSEPFFASGSPWRVLLMAVRRDCEDQVQPWIRRLSGGRELPARGEL